MPETNRPLLIVYAAAALSVALIGARYLKSVSAEQARPAALSAAPSTASTGRVGGGAVVVHVAGSVRHRGLVRLKDGDRVGDAIRAAGGATAAGDLNAVNLAARVADGQQVVVPARGAAGAGGAAGPVSLSSATLEQLDGLDEVGPGLAQKIIDYRTEHGVFRSVDELGEVPGIGDKRLESLRAQLQP